ncbi:hypothetical protein VTK73DRAFT_4068 [Phialemonium thermophilum]|uniref:Uncharacterized protein n=1 Tax=Phialemonium thermophilum TaxID=223376 RepID=A0ABR3VCV3_9PEZI
MVSRSTSSSSRYVELADRVPSMKQLPTTITLSRSPYLCGVESLILPPVLPLLPAPTTKTVFLCLPSARMRGQGSKSSMASPLWLSSSSGRKVRGLVKVDRLMMPAMLPLSCSCRRSIKLMAWRAAATVLHAVLTESLMDTTQLFLFTPVYPPTIRPATAVPWPSSSVPSSTGPTQSGGSRQSYSRNLADLTNSSWLVRTPESMTITMVS